MNYDPCVVTFFTNYAAASKNEMVVDLDDLVRRIRTSTGPDKASLPWLKLARFGESRTAKGSLRWDGNMLSISGIEADYDGEIMGVDAAVQLLHRNGVLAIVYTSPSHTEDAPRWRVLCPLSQEYTPDERDRFLARLNGLFDGIFSGESWTRSQSYYYGSINANPSHRVELLGGTPLDLSDEFDLLAIKKSEKPKTNGAAHHGPPTPPGAITDKRINGLIDTLLANIRAAPDGQKYFTLRDISFTVGGYLHLTGWSDLQAIEACVGALPSAKDWEHARKVSGDAIAAGRLKPLELADRPGHAPRMQQPRAREKGNGATPDDPPRQVPPEDPPGGVEPPEGGGGDPPLPPGGEPPVPEGVPDEPGANVGLITEQQAMRMFITMNKEVLRFNHSSGNWLIWADHFWRPDERKLAFAWTLNLARELAKEVRARDPSKARLVIEKISFAANVERGARAMPDVATAQTDWDADLMLLGTPGGVVDLTTGILRDGVPADMISRLTSVTPAVMPECPTFMKFLDFAMYTDTTGKDELVRFLQRYFGYCLTGRINEEVFLFLFGQGGAGKGTLIETIVHILGDYAGTTPMEVFTGKSWSPTEYYRADMAGKRLIVANEPERGSLWSEAFIKETTGGDTLSGRHPMGRPFRFRPTHKLALLGNHMPRLQGRSTGMERRLRIAPFDRKPEAPDTALKAKLLAEAPGILRWLIEGCLAWQKIGLAPPDSVMLANKKYFENQDVFARWIDEMCILDRYLELPPSTLLASYNAWAKANNEVQMSGNAFTEAIDQFEHEPPITRGRSNGKRWVKGLGLKVDPTTQSWGRP